jgi:hypothetical protein
MSDNVHMLTWVSRETKERFSALAAAQGVSESALLKRLAEALIGPSKTLIDSLPAVEPATPSGRLSIRLSVDDLALLKERALARGMAAATYISYLVRSHLRNLAPLPDAEFKVLQQSVAEVSAIGRNLNQIARASNAGSRPDGPSKADLQAILKACSALRDSFKEVLVRNMDSWKAGYEKAAR